ncbi:MAG TPA: hypothetical protein DFR83_07065 [Deltaproteobacteria bacterium]|nr:hypothetical protein [Deltaproteobacteria bacterium]
MRGLFAVLVLAACGAADGPAEAPAAVESPQTEPAVVATPETCPYATAPKGHLLTWTAFKFTERLGVDGGFDALTVTAGHGGDEPWKAIDGMAFHIDTASVNTGNAGRDEKIRNHFFGTLAQPDTISGRIKANSPGKATLFIELNGQRHATVVDVSARAEGVELRGLIDVQQWGAGAAIDALNTVCRAVHTGDDGVSKLWSEVQLVATIPIARVCR